MTIRHICSIKEAVNSFHILSRFSTLNPNLSECEIVGIGVLKGVKVALCGIHCVALNLHFIKMSEDYFSYSHKLKEEIHFCMIIANIQPVL